MNKKIKQILINTTLLLLIIFTLIIGVFSLLSGPLRVQQKNDKQIMNRFNEINQTNVDHILNRFTLDHVYYVASDNESIYAFSESGSMLFKDDLKTLPSSISEQLTNMSLSESELKYGYYKGEIVYVLKNKAYELYYSYKSEKLVFNLKLED